MAATDSIFKKTQGNLLAILCFLFSSGPSFSQQIIWSKLYPLPKADYINCIVQDSDHFMYAGGDTERNWVHAGGGIYYNRAMIIKLDPNGDTVFVKDLGIPGKVFSMAIDPYGNIRANISHFLSYSTLFISMTPDGLIFKRDSIYRTTPWSCIIGKDSSLIVVGEMDRTGFPGQRSMYFQRIQVDGTKDPIVELNPNHPDCQANQVEQLPNGNYLVSGYVGSRIASFELDELGFNPVFKIWYQSPDFSIMNSGHVSQIGGQRYMIGGQGNPSVVGQYDSLQNKYWLKKEIGTQIPPQAMTDGSVVYGYKKGVPPYQEFYRVGVDSNYIWNMPIRDSLVARGFWGNLSLKSFTYFADQSAVVAGEYNDGNATTSSDPFFIKITNVGTPVTSLFKPQKGSLANETLAPWPNPTSGKVYLKQHFDKAEVLFYGTSGKEMGAYKIKFGQPIDVSQYAAGIYFYRAIIDGSSYSGKILKY